ncbi:MAG: Gldg family protein [Candidatus Omnitrophica bacterium]|nr:Gldg family protein [Candidatus Omnitrophota bacterium]
MSAKPCPVTTVFRREIASYFNSSIAYIFIAVFVLLNGGFFMSSFFLIGHADMRSFFSILPYLLAIFLPAVSMRLWAEERRGNTLELLLTFPMRTEELVLGKFLASLVFYMVALAATLAIPMMLIVLGKPDLGAIAAAYLGVLLLGAFFLAIGIFISGLCRDQIVAFILTMVIGHGLLLIGSDFIAATVDGWIPGLGTWLNHFLGCLSHYESFARGVIDFKDTLYFLIGTAVFLVLNGFWLESRMRPKAAALFSGAVLISAGIFLVSNWFLSGIPLGRFDLTEGKIYTVSPATKKILHALKAPVTAKLYISPSEKMPAGMKTLERDITDKLDELRAVSQGKFQYKIFHMEAAPRPENGPQNEGSLEEQISQKGIQPFQVESIEADQVGVRLVYASMSLAYKEKPEEILGRLMPANLYELEYLILSRIYRMTLDQTPKIALIAPYTEKSVDPQMKALFAQLGAQVPSGYRDDEYEIVSMGLVYEGYEVARINLTEKETIPPGTKTLVIFEPPVLTERQKYEINRFLVEGGSLFMAVQNYDYQYQAASGTLEVIPTPKNAGVNALIGEWGFEAEEKILADEQNDIINIAGGTAFGVIPVTIPVRLPIQILIPSSQMNPDLSITSRLGALFYLWGAPLVLNDEKIKSQNLKVEKLFESSPKSWTVSFQPWTFSPENLEPNADSKIGPFPLAVMAEGQFKNIYEGKPVPDWQELPKPETPQPGTESAASQPVKAEGKIETLKPAPGKFILTGAATMFQKRLVQSGGHLNFLINSMDILTLGDELISIRAKQPVDRSLGFVSPAAKVGWRFVVTLLIPFIIGAFGAFRILYRHRLKEKFKKSLAAAGV